jgi:hypothetical protein
VATLETPVWSAERSARVNIETYLDRAISIIAMRKGKPDVRHTLLRKTAFSSFNCFFAFHLPFFLPPPQLKLVCRQKTHLSPREGIPRAFMRSRCWQNVTTRRPLHYTPC